MSKKQKEQTPVLEHLMEKLSASGQEEKDNRIVPEITFENPDIDAASEKSQTDHTPAAQQTETTANASEPHTEAASDRQEDAKVSAENQVPASAQDDSCTQNPQDAVQKCPEKPASSSGTPSPEKESEKHPAEERLENAELSFIDEAKDNPYHNVFVESLETITQDELGEKPKKKKKDPVDTVIDFIRSLVFWAAVAAFIISGCQIVFKLYSYQKADDLYSDIAGSIFSEEALKSREDIVSSARRSTRLQALTPINGTQAESDTVTDTAGSEVYNELFEMMKGQLSILRRKNDEVVGWIRMEGDTEINYPVVLHEDNEYYLHYAFDKSYNPAGSIFLDFRNQAALSGNRHSIIYGHNMESGSPMFANLLHYREAGYWDNNRYIDVYTEEALYTYEVFAAYECSPSQVKDPNHAWRMNFNKDPDIFLAWIDAVRERSDISPDVKIDKNSRILTLSTCTNANDQRYVVHAVLKETVK